MQNKKKTPMLVRSLRRRNTFIKFNSKRLSVLEQVREEFSYLRKTVCFLHYLRRAAPWAPRLDIIVHVTRAPRRRNTSNWHKKIGNMSNRRSGSG
jgi:hypothetical protein